MSEQAARLVQAMRGASKTSGSGIEDGTVLDAGGGTLRIRCMGLELDKEFLYLPAGLDCAWTEDDGTPELLRPGDKLLCWTADKQTFYILCKAVTV